MASTAVRFPAFTFIVSSKGSDGNWTYRVTEGVAGPGLGWRSVLQQAIRQVYRLRGALQPNEVRVLGVTDVDDALGEVVMVRTSRNEVLSVRVRRAMRRELQD